MDLKSQCQAQYVGDPTCTVCAAYQCTHDDRICVTDCPAYYYFKTYRTYAASDLLSSKNIRYANYTDIT